MRTLVTSLVAMMLLVLSAGNVVVPVCADVAASVLLGDGSIWLSVVVGNVFLLILLATRSRASGVRFAVIAISAAAVTMTASSRSHREKRAMWTFDGRIAERYESAANHNARSVRLDSGMSFDFVAADFWNAVKIGDHVVKAACSEFAEVDGRRVRIVPE